MFLVCERRIQPPVQHRSSLYTPIDAGQHHVSDRWLARERMRYPDGARREKSGYRNFVHAVDQAASASGRRTPDFALD